MSFPVLKSALIYQTLLHSAPFGLRNPVSSSKFAILPWVELPVKKCDL
jgi:hypothetical protein